MELSGRLTKEKVNKEITVILYDLRSVRRIPLADIAEYFNEFNENGEHCHLMWRAYEIPIEEWHREVSRDIRNHYVGFYVNEKLAGIGRVSPRPNYSANGNLGYGLRPSMRGNGYAPVMLRLMEGFCKDIGMDLITACVDENNGKSITTLMNAGYKPTGVVYDWIDGRKAIELAFPINSYVGIM